MVQATDAAEKVQLVVREADPDVIGMHGNPTGASPGCGCRATRKLSRQHTEGNSLRLLGSARVDGRKQVGTLDAVLRLSALHIQNRDAQVAIVGKRQRDQLLKLRIGKELAPADVGGGGALRLCRLGSAGTGAGGR